MKWAAGKGPMDQIFESAAKKDPPGCALEFEDARLRLLVSICQELQAAAGASPFFLSCRTAGRLVGVDHTCASRWLRGLQGEVLELVTAGTTRSRRASRYRYLGDR